MSPISPISLIHRIRLRTWVALGLILVLAPLTFAAIHGVFGASGGSNAAPAAVWYFDEAVDNTCSGGTNDVCDSSGNGNDGAFGSGTAAPGWRTEDLCVSGKCLFFDGTNDTITVANTISNVRTVVFWVKPITSTEEFIALNGSTNITVSGGTVTATGFTSPTIYVNGKVSSTLSANNHWQHVAVTTGTGISASAITIGNVSTNFGNIFMDEVKLFTTTLTADQIRAEYTGGAAVFSDQSQFLSDGLAGYWNMDHNSGNATDRSGNGVTLTNNGTTPYGIGRYGQSPTFNGSSRYFNTAITLSNVQTLSFWVRPASTTDNFIHLASGVYINSSSGTISATGFTSPTIYVNGVVSSTISASSWQMVTIVTQTPISANAFEVGRANSAYAVNNSRIDEVRVYNRALSPAEVKKLYEWAPGPIGSWKFDEGRGTTVFDRSVNGNNGSFTNMPAEAWKVGRFGQAINVTNNNTARVNFGSPDLYDNLNQFSGAFWLYPTWYGKVLSKDENNILSYPQAGWSFELDTNLRLYFRIGYGSFELQKITNNGAVALNSWSHVAFTYDGSGLASGVKIFVNGVEQSYSTSSGGSGSMNDSAYDLLIGNSDSLNNSFRGLMDELKLYNYPRTQQQIIEDMNGGHPTGGSPIGSHVAYWKFDEMNGSTAYDDSINSNNLTLSSASWTTSGKFNGAWNGTGALWLSRADDADFDVSASDDYTISLWFKSDSATNPSSTEYLFNKANATTAGYAVYVNTSGQVCFGIDDDTTWGPDVASCSTADVYDNSWHHLVAVRNVGSDQLQLYVDGLLVDSDTDPTTATLANSLSLYVGDRDGVDNGDEFNGDIDEIKVFRSALTPEQVKIVMNANSIANFGVGVDEKEELVDGAGSPPVVWLTFDENTGSTSYDKSGNGINGSLISAGSGNFARWTSGKIGTGVYVFSNDNDSGFDQYAHVSLPNDSLDSYSQGTISFWFKPDDTNEDNYQMLFYNGDITGTVSDAIEIGFLPLTDQIALWTNGCTTNIEGTANIPGNVTDWHHVVWTITTGANRLYIDGAPVAVSYTIGSASSKCFFDEVAEGETHIRLGCAARSGTACDELETYDGMYDNFKIFNYALTPSQVAYEYNRGKPIVWYKMDECSGTTLYDLSTRAVHSGAGLNGTLNLGTGGVTSAGTCTTSGAWFNGASGKINYSMDFDGNDDVVSIANNSVIDLNEGLRNGFTFAGWIYPNTVGETAGRIFQKGADGSTTDSSTTFCRVEGSSPFNIVCRVDLATSDANFTVSGVAPANQWTHVAFSWTNDADDEVTIWVNGVPYTSTASFDGDPAAENNSLYIGGNGTGANNTRAFDGQIDDVRIYTYELSQTQIRKVMNDGASVRWGPATGSP